MSEGRSFVETHHIPLDHQRDVDAGVSGESPRSECCCVGEADSDCGTDRTHWGGTLHEIRHPCTGSTIFATEWEDESRTVGRVGVRERSGMTKPGEKSAKDAMVAQGQHLSHSPWLRVFGPLLLVLLSLLLSDLCGKLCNRFAREVRQFQDLLCWGSGCC